MKKNLLTIAVILIIAITFGEIAYAQFGDLINKAKDAAKKKDKPKEQPKSTDSQGSGSGKNESNKSENNNSANAVVSEYGTFYFSNQPFPSDGSTTGAKTSFNSGESIYGRLVLQNGTIREVLKPASPEAKINDYGDKIKGYNVDFLLYRIEKSSYRNSISNLGRIYKAIIDEADLDKTYWDFDVLPPPNNARSLFYWGGNPNDGMTFAFDMYLFMTNTSTKEGDHEIILSIKSGGVDFRGNALPDNERKEIEGKFNFNFRGSDYATVKANYDNLDKNFVSNYKKQKTENQAVPPEWSAKTSPIIGGYTTASVSSLFLNSFSDGNVLKMVKLYAAPPKGQGMWVIQNNNYGIPNYRYSTQWFTAFVRRTDNGNCFFQGFGLRQNYAGAGTYGNTIIDHGDSALIKCDKLGLK